jgi:hypothetical protein
VRNGAPATTTGSSLKHRSPSTNDAASGVRLLRAASCGSASPDVGLWLYKILFGCGMRQMRGALSDHRRVEEQGPPGLGRLLVGRHPAREHFPDEEAVG